MTLPFDKGTIVVRPIKSADRAAWLRMRRALWPECSDERHALEIQHYGGFPSNHAVVFVAEDSQGGACAFVEVSIRHDPVDAAKSSPVAFVEGWYVDAEFRGQGIGRQLLEYASDWAAERGLTELASDADLHNDGSIKAHFACGFRETNRTVNFIKPVAADAAARGEDRVSRVRVALSDADIVACWPVMAQLRPHVSEAEFLPRVRRQMAEGYRLAFIRRDDVVAAVAGFRIQHNLFSGRILYVDDLVTSEQSRSQGLGAELLEWLCQHARAEGCQKLELDSGVQRHGAHRFYLAQRMDITSYRFAIKLGENKQ